MLVVIYIFNYLLFFLKMNLRKIIILYIIKAGKFAQLWKWLASV